VCAEARGGATAGTRCCREDIFLLKVKALGKKRAGKHSAQAAAGGQQRRLGCTMADRGSCVLRLVSPKMPCIDADASC